MVKRRVNLLVCSVLLALLAGCVEVGGAACEFSWSLRTFAGQPIQECAQVRIEKIQLVWLPVGAPAGTPPTGSQTFECATTRGLTKFVIDEGSQLFAIVPICRNDAPPDPDTYNVPPPIARDMRDGEVVTLSSLLIVAEPDCSKECTCPLGGTSL